MSQHGINDPDCNGECLADKFDLVYAPADGCPAHDKALNEMDSPSRQLLKPGFRYCPRGVARIRPVTVAGVATTTVAAAGDVRLQELTTRRHQELDAADKAA